MPFCSLAWCFRWRLLDPSKSIPGTDWHPWLYLREIVQLFLVALSLVLGSQRVREDNNFNYAAIIEVAALFFGIFITMQPALQILAIRGPSLGLTEQWHFFWATGGLSSVLDNAPTYVVFFTTAQAVTAKLGLSMPIAGVSEPLLGRHQPWCGVHGSEYLYRQRAEFHGQGHCRKVGCENARLFRVYAI